VSPDTTGLSSVDEALDRFHEHSREIETRFAPLLKAILTDVQFKRLTQIDLQLSPPDVLLRSEVATALKLDGGSEAGDPEPVGSNS